MSTLLLLVLVYARARLCVYVCVCARSSAVVFIFGVVRRCGLPSLFFFVSLPSIIVVLCIRVQESHNLLVRVWRRLSPSLCVVVVVWKVREGISLSLSHVSSFRIAVTGCFSDHLEVGGQTHRCICIYIYTCPRLLS